MYIYIHTYVTYVYTNYVNVFSEIIEGSLEVKFPTIWTDEKQRWQDSEKRREEKKKEDQPFGQWIRSAVRDSQRPTSPIAFLCLKLPVPQCAVLLDTTGVYTYICNCTYMFCIWYKEQEFYCC